MEAVTSNTLKTRTEGKVGFKELPQELHTHLFSFLPISARVNFACTTHFQLFMFYASSVLKEGVDAYALSSEYAFNFSIEGMLKVRDFIFNNREKINEEYVPCTPEGRQYLISEGIGGPKTARKIQQGLLTIQAAIEKREDIQESMEREFDCLRGLIIDLTNVRDFERSMAVAGQLLSTDRDDWRFPKGAFIFDKLSDLDHHLAPQAKAILGKWLSDSKNWFRLITQYALTAADWEDDGQQEIGHETNLPVACHRLFIKQINQDIQAYKRKGDAASAQQRLSLLLDLGIAIRFLGKSPELPYINEFCRLFYQHLFDSYDVGSAQQDDINSYIRLISLTDQGFLDDDAGEEIFLPHPYSGNFICDSKAAVLIKKSIVFFQRLIDEGCLLLEDDIQKLRRLVENTFKEAQKYEESARRFFTIKDPSAVTDQDYLTMQPEDLAKAIEYYGLAARAGHPHARKKNLELLTIVQCVFNAGANQEKMWPLKLALSRKTLVDESQVDSLKQASACYNFAKRAGYKKATTIHLDAVVKGTFENARIYQRAARAFLTEPSSAPTAEQCLAMKPTELATAIKYYGLAERAGDQEAGGKHSELLTIVQCVFDAGTNWEKQLCEGGLYIQYLKDEFQASILRQASKYYNFAKQAGHPEAAVKHSKLLDLLENTFKKASEYQLQALSSFGLDHNYLEIKSDHLKQAIRFYQLADRAGHPQASENCSILSELIENILKKADECASQVLSALAQDEYYPKYQAHRKQAIEHYAIAESAGHPEARVKLLKLLEKIPMTAFEKAAEWEKDALSFFNTDQDYLKIVPDHLTRAIELYKFAEKAGHGKAHAKCSELSELVENIFKAARSYALKTQGFFTDQSYLNKAIKHYELAEQVGHPEARLERLKLLASKKEDATAQLELGELYLNKAKQLYWEKKDPRPEETQALLLMAEKELVKAAHNGSIEAALLVIQHYFPCDPHHLQFPSFSSIAREMLHIAISGIFEQAKGTIQENEIPPDLQKILGQINSTAFKIIFELSEEYENKLFLIQTEDDRKLANFLLKIAVEGKNTEAIAKLDQQEAELEQKRKIKLEHQLKALEQRENKN